MKPSELLQKARARIEDPARWYRGAFGDNGDLSTRCCAWGAVRWEDSGSPYGTVSDVADYAMELLSEAAVCLFDDCESIVGVNDKLGHEAVLCAYDVAISMALYDEAAR